MPLGGLDTIVIWLAAVLATIAIPVLIIALGLGLGLRLARAGRPDPGRFLRERLARGEITVDEFETARRALGD